MKLVPRTQAPPPATSIKIRKPRGPRLRCGSSTASKKTRLRAGGAGVRIEAWLEMSDIFLKIWPGPAVVQCRADLMAGDSCLAHRPLRFRGRRLLCRVMKKAEIEELFRDRKSTRLNSSH